MSTDVKSMDVKRTQQIPAVAPKNVAPAKEGSSFLKQLPEFVGDVKTEFKKISWTSKEELVTYTQAVVGATFFLGLGVYFVDLTIQTALWIVESFVRVFLG